MWRKFIAALFVAALAAAAPTPSAAQSDYPSRMITLVVPFAPGGATDTIGRIVAQHLSKDLGQNVIVDNRPAAAGTVGSAQVAKAAPDGYTLLLGSTDTVVVNAHLYKKLSFNPLADLAPIAMVGDAPEFIVVSASLPAKDLREFAALARAKEGSFNYGSPGLGTIPHLAGEQLAKMMGTKMVHIPFRGSAAAMKEVATGEIQLSIATKASADAFVESGKAKFLAIASTKRFESLPDVPTSAEAGLPGYEIHNWWGVLAPTGTPAPVIAKLNASLQKMFDPQTTALFTRQGIVPVRTSVQEFADRIRKDDPRWKEIVSNSGVKME